MSESSGSTDGQGNGEAALGEGVNRDNEPAAGEGATDMGADQGATEQSAGEGATDVSAVSAGEDASDASPGEDAPHVSAAGAGPIGVGATDTGSGAYGATNGGDASEDSNRAERRARNRKRAIGITVAALAIEMGWLWQRGHGVGGNVIVRCRDGHLFTTIWIPGISVKSLRFGFWRVQYCPVGKHWSLVIPANRSGLSGRELKKAGEQRDIRIP